MNQINYATMSDQELRQYFIQNRNDKLALAAYLERRNQVKRPIIAKVDDPDFDTKIQAAICQQINQHEG
jgi:hypothetical protein